MICSFLSLCLELGMTLALSPREEIPWFSSGIGTIKRLVVYHGMARAMRDVAEQPMDEGVAPSTLAQRNCRDVSERENTGFIINIFRTRLQRARRCLTM